MMLKFFNKAPNLLKIHCLRTQNLMNLHSATLIEIERVEAAWARIEVWYQINAPQLSLPAGTNIETIEKLEKDLNLALPPSLQASLRIHNGVERPKWPNGTLFSTDGILREWQEWTVLYDKYNSVGFPEKAETDGNVQAVPYCRSWIPVAGKDDTSVIFVDFDPDPKGEGDTGQIIIRDSKGKVKVSHPDFASYLEEVAKNFEEGKFYVDNNELKKKP